MKKTLQGEPFRPVFIGGAGRSGTTLLRTMLASHPAMVGGNEFKLLPQVAELWRAFSALPEVMGQYQLSEDYLNTHFAQFAEGLFRPYLKQSGDLRLVEKTPHNILAADFLTGVFPQAQLIHMVRDGRDVACSLVNMDWYGPDGKKVWYTASIEAAASYWRQVVENGMAAAQHSAGQIKTLRYESLLKRPSEGMAGVLEWLDEPWHDSVVDRSRRAALVAGEVKESSSQQVTAALNTRTVGRWHRDMTADERRAFHRVAGGLLLKLGYIKGDDWL